PDPGKVRAQNEMTHLRPRGQAHDEQGNEDPEPASRGKPEADEETQHHVHLSPSPPFSSGDGDEPSLEMLTHRGAKVFPEGRRCRLRECPAPLSPGGRGGGRERGAGGVRAGGAGSAEVVSETGSAKKVPCFRFGLRR